jgi:hypothetical protein
LRSDIREPGVVRSLAIAIAATIVAALVDLAVLPTPMAAQTPTVRIRLEPAGESFETDGTSSTVRKIYSIAIGSPEQGEALALRWTPHFGMHALDATLWVRQSNSSDRWKQVTFRRPRSAEGIKRFATEPGTFEQIRHGDLGILPAPFNGLTRSNLDLLDHIVTYASGGTRALLRVGATDQQAEALLGALSRAEGGFRR